MSVVADVVATVAFVLITTGLIAFFVFLIGGSLSERKMGSHHRALLTGEPPTPTCDQTPIYFLVPALNEELVIGPTVASLVSDHHVIVVVIDDGSDDATSAMAESAARSNGRVLIVRRDLPDARKGKGPALNAGLGAIVKHLHSPGVSSPDEAIVCILDPTGDFHRVPSES